MTDATASQDLSRAARIIHVAILSGILVLLAIFGYLSSSGFGAVGALLPSIARLLGGLIAAIGLVGVALGRRRLRSPDRGGDAGFWQANLGSAALVWALAETPDVAGAVLWFLSGDVWLGVALGGFSILLLVLNSPARLQEA